MRSEPSGDELLFKSACAQIAAGESRGTGFLVAPTGVLTCHHVVRDVPAGSPVQVQFPHGTYLAAVETVDQAQDCVLLRLSAPVTEAAPLPIARELPPAGTPFVSYGFPSATLSSGLLLNGRLQDRAGEDLSRRVSLVLFSPQITAGAALQGFSGSPVLSGGAVIGQLRQVVPDAAQGAQFGIVYACPATDLVKLLPARTEVEIELQPPGCAYDQKWYVPRPNEERRALGRLGVRGGAVVLQGPPLTGKTWLMQHLLHKESRRSAIVHLSLRALSTSETATTYGGFLRELARRVVSEAVSTDAATITALIAEAWSFSQDPVSNLSHLLGRRVLPSFGDNRQLILAIDDADSIGQRPYAQEFFSLLRAWMDASHRAPWSALRLLMSLTRSPELLIQDPNRSPFNIAQTLTLHDFDGQQIALLAQRHHLAWEESQLRKLAELVGGHPYLLRLAMYEVHLTRQPLGDVLQSTHPLYGEFLRDSERRLRKVPGLHPTFLRLLTDPHSALTDSELEPLRCLGLIVEDEADGSIRVRYPLLRRLQRGRS